MLSVPRLLCMLPVLLLAPLGAAAQTGGPTDPRGTRLREEYQRVSGQLARIEERVMRDSALQAMNTRLGAELLTAMNEADPDLQADLVRVRRLEEQLRSGAAQEATSTEGVASELEDLRRRYAQAQTVALRDADLAAKVRTFDSLLRRRMREESPRADSLLERFGELHARLSPGTDGGNP